MGWVTSSSAKTRPPRPGFDRRIVDLRGGPFSRTQSVCAIAGDTSAYPAGTPPAFWRLVKDWTDQRHALEWFEAERYHDGARARGHECEFSGSKEFWATDRLLFSFFRAPRDQAGLVGQPECHLAAERGWQMEIAGFDMSTSRQSPSFCREASEHFAHRVPPCR